MSFRITGHKFSTLRTCFNADTLSHCWRSNSPPSGHSPSLLAANLTPPHPAVIFHLSCWQSNSPFPTSCHGGQTLPSPPSGHPPPLLAVKLSPPTQGSWRSNFLPTQRSWRSNSPLSAQWSWRSSSPLSAQRSWRSNSPLSAQWSWRSNTLLPPSGHGGQPFPFHPAVMAVKLSHPTQRSWRSTFPLPPSGHGGPTFTRIVATLLIRP